MSLVEHLHQTGMENNTTWCERLSLRYLAAVYVILKDVKELYFFILSNYHD
jgi:hypothetical protein